MADLLSWMLTHSLALGVGFVAGAGGFGAAQLAWRRVKKGYWFGPAPAEAADKTAKK